jgi:hemoglobin-like flavoprotein
MNDLDPVRASYDRCFAQGDFAGHFYERFFRQSPEIPPLFAHTDFVEQKRHLRASLLTLIKYAPDDVVTSNLLHKIGHSHSRAHRNIRPEWYPLFGTALFETLAADDPEWTPDLANAWKNRIGPGIALIISLYDSQ